MQSVSEAGLMSISHLALPNPLNTTKAAAELPWWWCSKLDKVSLCGFMWLFFRFNILNSEGIQAYGSSHDLLGGVHLPSTRSPLILQNQAQTLQLQLEHWSGKHERRKLPFSTPTPSDREATVKHHWTLYSKVRNYIRLHLKCSPIFLSFWCHV